MKAPADAAYECRLKVLTQPNETFYKDMGGKKTNVLSTTIQLLDKKGHVPKLLKPLVIQTSLVYESGRKIQVEDQKNIFNPILWNGQPLTIGKNGTACLDFRLEKVSRRLDGQRLKVRFDVLAEDVEESVVKPNTTVKHVCTGPIMVMSKIKPNRKRKDSPSAQSCSSKRRSVERGPSLLSSNNERVAKLEKMIRQMQGQLEQVYKVVQDSNLKILELKRHTEGAVNIERFASVIRGASHCSNIESKNDSVGLPELTQSSSVPFVTRWGSDPYMPQVLMACDNRLQSPLTGALASSTKVQSMGADV